MPSRKTPEEMALAIRLKVARSNVRLKHSIQADIELNGLLADITDDHNLALHSGEVKELGDGLSKFIEEIADIEAVIHGVPKEPRTLPE